MNSEVKVIGTKWMAEEMRGRAETGLVLLYDDNTWETILRRSECYTPKVFDNLNANSFRFKTKEQARKLRDQLICKLP